MEAPDQHAPPSWTFPHSFEIPATQGSPCRPTQRNQPSVPDGISPSSLTQTPPLLRALVPAPEELTRPSTPQSSSVASAAVRTATSPAYQLRKLPNCSTLSLLSLRANGSSLFTVQATFVVCPKESVEKRDRPLSTGQTLR